MTAACNITGDPNMYGRGIRVSFYLLWFAIPIGERFNERHTKVLRGAELILASAVFLGLCMTVAAGSLHAVEVYIVLLLITATVYLLVPQHSSDLVAWIRPEFGLGTQHEGFGILATARCLFVITVVGFQLWFWGTGVNSSSMDRRLRREGGGCRPPHQVGFAFGPLELSSGGFRALNILLMLALLGGCVLICAIKAGFLKRKRSRRRRRAKYVSKNAPQILCSSASSRFRACLAPCASS